MERNEEQDELNFIKTAYTKNNGKMHITNQQLTEDELLMIGIIEDYPKFNNIIPFSKGKIDTITKNTNPNSYFNNVSKRRK
jgi:hypothetical protein